MQAIGSSATASYVRVNEGSTGLQAQLSRLEKELSACVNCATATTTEGKAKIEEVSTRIARVRDRIVQSKAAEPDKPAALARTQSPERLANTDNGFTGERPAGLGALIDTLA